MKRLVIVLVLLTTGCSSTMACTLVGCTSEASFRLHDLSPTLHYPLTAHACFDERCADVTIPQDPPATGTPMSASCPGEGRRGCFDLRSTQGYVAVDFGDPPAGRAVHRASVVVRDASGSVVVASSQPLRLVKLAPNGARCGPICWSGTADFR